MVCSRSTLDHGNQAGKTWSWPGLQLPFRLAFPQAPLCPQNKGAERAQWLLFQCWAPATMLLRVLEFLGFL